MASATQNVTSVFPLLEEQIHACHLGRSNLPGWHADSSRRAFYKEFVKVVEAADVIIEVLDARDPLSTRCTDVERYVRRSGASKKLILLLNKIGEPPCPRAPVMLPSC